MKKYFYLLYILLASLPVIARAQVDPLESLRQVGTEAYGQPEPADLKMTIARIIQFILGFVGILFVVFIIISGLQWMMSGGNEKKIEDAKRHIVAATVGLVIIVISYSIAYTITKWLGQAVSGCSYPDDFIGPLPPGCERG